MMSTEMVSEAPMVSAVQRSPWHSPVPYLFGGLAAMLGLIAFALLILACSYWKFSGYLDRDNDDANSDDRDVELGATFLATPISSKASSFGSNSSASQMPDNKSDSGDRTDNPKDNQSQDDQTETHHTHTGDPRLQPISPADLCLSPLTDHTHTYLTHSIPISSVQERGSAPTPTPQHRHHTYTPLMRNFLPHQSQTERSQSPISAPQTVS
ncbi:hypothetical protein CsSME_00032031 [Camellia sinensis var. sinensis]